jgi:hypothetical protein
LFKSDITAGEVVCCLASWGEGGTPSNKERTYGLWDNSYRFPGMEIAIDEGGIDEELREEKLLLAIRLDSILNTGERRSEQNSLSRGSDLFSSKLLYPATHSLPSIRFEVKNDVDILIEVKDGKVFFGVDNDRVLPQSLFLL